jgi:ribose transport system substrate-binding protein
MAISRRSTQQIGRVPSFMIGAIAAVALAACSSSGNGSATGASTTPAGQSSPASSAAVGQAAAAKALYTQLMGAPTLGLSVPLTTKPPAGKKVYWLAGNVEVINQLTSAVQAATTALGWDYHSISYTYGDPQSTSGAIQQAVAAHADYIVISGASVAAMGQGLQEAKAAHIPVFDMSGQEAPEGSGNGVYSDPISLDGVTKGSEALIDFAIAQSNADAHILYVNYTDSPTLAATETAVKKSLPQLCSACSITDVDVTSSALGDGSIPGLVVSALQRDPSINYVFFAFDSVFTGVPQAVEAAGLSGRVKLIGYELSAAEVAALQGGSLAAGVPLPEGEMAWAALDEAARYSEGMNLDWPAHQELSLTLWTPKNVPSTLKGEWQGIDGYQNQFKQLWRVG